MNIKPLENHKNIYNDDKFREKYYAIKDARMSAKQNEAQGDITSGVLEQWKEVHSKATHLIAEGYIDLELCAWLAESTIRIDGFSGLTKTFRLICELITTHDTSMHSTDSAEADLTFWLMPITGLSGERHEGALVQPLRLCSLIPGTAYGRCSLWQHQTGMRDRTNPEYLCLVQAVKEAGTDVMLAQRQTIYDCISSFEAMVFQFDKLFPSHPMPQSNILEVLRACGLAITQLAQLKNVPNHGQPLPSKQEAEETFDQTASHVTHTRLKIESREHALRLLTDIAIFFQLQEPQSPIAPALETLIRRGQMSFSNLLEELLPNPEPRLAILTAAGIHYNSRDEE